MDDLKIIFYIVVTIIWFFYNNYRKVQKKARERDITESPEPIDTGQDDPFDWERELFPPETESKKPEPIVKELTTRELATSNTDIKEPFVPKPAFPSFQNDIKTLIESTPQSNIRSTPENVISHRISTKRQKRKKSRYDIKGTNWKKAVIISEVLNPPYL